MPSLPDAHNRTHVHCALTNGRAKLADKARLTFDGHTGLVDWSIDRKAPLSLSPMGGVPASLVESLTNASYPIEGLLNGQISGQSIDMATAGARTCDACASARSGMSG